MLAFFIQRLLQAIVVMIAVGFIAFSLFNFVGDPVSLMLPPEATSADRDEVRKSLGLPSLSVMPFKAILAFRCGWGVRFRNCSSSGCQRLWNSQSSPHRSRC